MLLQSLQRKTLAAILSVTLLLSQTVFAAAPIIQRPQAPESAKWNLSELYATPQAFEAELAAIRTEMEAFAPMAGTLNNAKAIRAYFDLAEKLGRRASKATVYAYFNYSLNQSDSAAQEMNALAESVLSELGGATAFADPEILKLSEQEIQKLSQDPLLQGHRMYFSRLLKQKAHTLSEKEEALLSAATGMAGTPSTLYDMLTVADYEKPVIQGKDGQDIEVSRTLYGRLLDDPDRALRKAAYEAEFGAYQRMNNTLGANYIGEIKKNMFFSEARNYGSALEGALSAEDIDRSIYDNLVSSVNRNLTHLHRYYALKKKYLGVEELHLYDSYRSLVQDYSLEYTYDEANTLILKSLAPLGKDYLDTYRKAITSRWIDVYEDENKETGAYQWGAYDTHPFVLLNYDNSLDAALTMAHEMGHAMQSWYSNKNQSYFNAEYPIFTAEVASTMNELLVMDTLIRNAKNDTEKLYLINSQIENIKGTVYQQVMYSEFEQKAHALAESGEPMSAETLNTLWEELVKKYYGPAFTSDEYLKYGWSRIPHFYYDFYVYKYATSMSAAYSLSKGITAGDAAAVDRYMTFLGAGDSDYPVTLLQQAGVDMNTSKPVDELLTYFGSLLTEMERLLEKQAAK